MSDKVTASQAYEWVKTGHWNKRQFLEWNRGQLVPHHKRYFDLMEEMERMCEFTRELQNKIATSVVVSTDAFDVFGMASAQEDQETVFEQEIEDARQHPT